MLVPSNTYLQAKPDTILYITWYFILSLTIPSLLQASSVGLLLFAISLWCCRQGFKPAWQAARTGLVLILAAFLFGTLTSSMTDKSLIGLYDASRAFALFFVFASILPRLDPDRVLLTARYFLLLATTLVFFLFIFLGMSGDTFLLRYNSTLNNNIGNLHEFANLIAVLLLFCACLILSRPAPDKKLLLSLAVLTLILMATLSKGNWLSVFICGLYLVTARKHRQIWRISLVCVLLAYLYIFFICSCTVDLPSFLEATLHSRKNIYATTLAFANQHPFTGHGINTFKYAGIVLTPGGTPYVMPHNIYLEQLYSWGIPGLLLFFGGLISLTKSVLPHTLANPRARHFLLTSGHTLLIYALSRGLLDMKFYSFHYLGLLTVSAALIVSAGQKPLRQAAGTEPV